MTVENRIERLEQAIEQRWGEGRIDRFPQLIAEIVSAKVDVIVTDTTPGTIAARNATRTIPIVSVEIGDPVAAGLAESLAHPGGNVTGMSVGFDSALTGKYLEFLQETVPHLSSVGIIANPASLFSMQQAEDIRTLAVNRGLKARLFKVRERKELEGAMNQARRQTQAIVVIPDPLTREHSKTITALAAKYRLPAIYALPEFIETLTVNLRTAQALGLTIPESILLRADEVIR